MKFLIITLCVCAASAASFGGYKPQPQQPFNAFAKAAVVPVSVAKAVVEIPAVTAYKAVKNVASEVYSSAKNAYSDNKDALAETVHYDSDVSSTGFKYAFEGSNGISAAASGDLKLVGNEQFLVSKGYYKYFNADGSVVEVRYIADENGYQPESNVLPIGPETPEHVLRALEYIKLHPYKEVQ